MSRGELLKVTIRGRINKYYATPVKEARYRYPHRGGGIHVALYYHYYYPYRYPGVGRIAASR